MFITAIEFSLEGKGKKEEEKRGIGLRLNHTTSLALTFF